MSYRVIEFGVQRLSDGATIPSDPANIDWREFMAWRADGGTPEPQYTLHEARAVRAAAIAAEAGARILAAYPDYAQRNMLARASELIEAQLGGNPLNPAQVAERAVLRAARAWINSMRGAVAAARAEIAAATTAEQVLAVQPAWPNATPPVWPM